MTEDKMAMLMDVVKSINSGLAADETLQLITSEAKSITQSESGSLILAEEGTRNLRFVASTDKNQHILKMLQIPAGQGIAGIVAETGDAIIVNDAGGDSRIFKDVDDATNTTTRNLICVPLKLKGRVLGVLEVINRLNGEYGEDDLLLLKSFADFAALAINNRELYRRARRKARETEALYNLAESINTPDSLEDLLESNMGKVCKTLDACGASILLKEGNSFPVKCSVGFDGKGDRIQYENVIEHALNMGRGIFCPDLRDEDRIKRTIGEASFMLMPLRLRESIFGFICVTGRKNGRPYEYSDFQLLEMLARQVAENVNYLKLWREYKDKQIIETELALTARMQREILPRVFPVKKGFDIAALSIPARLVGGDFYDFIPIGRGKYLVIMADVSGKGLSACVFMAISRSILRAQLDHVNDPALILELANRRIFEESISGMFVTCFCCIVNPSKKTLTFSNAGHLAQYLLKKEKDDMEKLHIQGRPLGVMRDSSYSSRTIDLGSGDILFLFTDGLTETLNNRFEEYGEERLINSLKRARNCHSCSTIAEKVIEDHSRFKGSAEIFDDITLMAVRF